MRIKVKTLRSLVCVLTHKIIEVVKGDIKIKFGGVINKFGMPQKSPIGQSS